MSGIFPEHELVVRLRERYALPEWVFLSQVRNGAGYVANRTLDGLALNLWPSRGMEIHGFECKSYRGDWLKELKNPQKADDVMACCDRFWIVASDDVVKKEEVPATWGWIKPLGKGLRTVVEAALLSPVKVDKSFLAAILKRALDYTIPKGEVALQIRNAEAKGREEGRKDAERDLTRATRDLESLQGAVKEFEAASGVHINSWNGARIGEAVKIILDRTWEPSKIRMQAQAVIDAIDALTPISETESREVS